VLTNGLGIDDSVLQNGGSSLDAVEKIICILEELPPFNAESTLVVLGILLTIGAGTCQIE